MEKQAQAWIPELGLGFGQRPRRCRHLRYYYKARIYSPTLGRFLQTDPIGYEDQYNLYAYVGNDPINAVDPSGKQLAVVFAELYYPYKLDRTTDLDQRKRLASLWAGTLEGHNVRGDGAYEYERQNRPTTLRNPNSLLPTQSNYGETMKDENGRRITIDEQAERLSSGQVDPNDVKPARVFRDENGDMRTLDHRRVVAAQRAGVEVRTIELTLEEAQNESGGAGRRARTGRFPRWISRGMRPPRMR